MYRDGRVVVGVNCPVNGEREFDISSDDFVFSVTSCERKPDGPRVDDEIFGFFRPSGLDEDDQSDGFAETDGIYEKTGSAESTLARQLKNDPTGDSVHLLGEELRHAVMRCPCEHVDECPALGSFGLLSGMMAAKAKREKI